MNARFKECRKNANLSQKEVASALKVSVQAVSYWENGSRMPNHENCLALAALYNVTVGYLLGADEQPMIGKNIAALRKKHKLTQDEFAKLVHVTQGAVSQWETGRTYPDTLQLIQIAKIFNVDIKELTGDEEMQSAINFTGEVHAGKSNALRYANIDIGDGETNIVYTNHNPQPEIIGSIMDYGRKNSDMASVRRADKRSKLKEAFDELVNEMNDEQIQQFDLFIQLMKSRGK